MTTQFDLDSKESKSELAQHTGNREWELTEGLGFHRQPPTTDWADTKEWELWKPTSACDNEAAVLFLSFALTDH